MTHSFSIAGAPLAVLFAVALVLSPAESSAELVAVDLNTAGDQLLTRDTATGFEWLDLTATLNLSAREIQDGAGGIYAAGFVHASTEQVRTLFLNSDPGNVVINTGANPTSPANVTGAQLLLDLMGITYIQPPGGNDFDIVGNGIAGIGEPGPDSVHFADYGTNSEGTLGFFFVPDGTAPDTYKDPQTGNYLFRVMAIPEPANALLFIISLTLLWMARSRPLVCT